MDMARLFCPLNARINTRHHNHVRLLSMNLTWSNVLNGQEKRITLQFAVNHTDFLMLYEEDISDLKQINK